MARVSLKVLWAALLNEMNDDSDITDVIGTQNIHRSNPATALKFPTLILDGVANAVSLTGIGLYRSSPTWNVYAADHDQADDLFSALQENWSIPTKRPAGFSVTEFEITHLVFDKMIEVGPARVVATQERVTHFAILSRLNVRSRQDQISS